MSGAHLAKIVGENDVLERPIDRIVYSTDASTAEGSAEVIVLPESVEQVHAIVLYANRTGTPVVIRGAGTGLAGGAVPQKGMVMDLSKLNAIVKINKAERFAVVEAGVVLDDLNYALAPDLAFPVRPSSHSVCTIGGMIATNAAGNNAIKYGTVLNWVEELEVIDGTGKMFTVKGADIKSFCGREGTTGVVVRARLKLAAPVMGKSLVFFPVGDVAKLASEVERYGKVASVSAIEYINPVAAEFAGLKKSHYLLIEYESTEGPIRDATEIERTWAVREGITQYCGKAGFIMMEDPKLPAARIPEFLAWIEERGLPCFGHIGIGILHPMFPINDEKRINEMYLLVEKLGGRVSGEHGIGLTKRQYATRGLVEEIKGLKKQYDPDNMLNRGKII